MACRLQAAGSLGGYTRLLWDTQKTNQGTWAVTRRRQYLGRKLDFVAEQQNDCLDRVPATVYVVTKKQVRLVRQGPSLVK